MVLGHLANNRTRIYGWLADRGGCGYYRIMQPLTTLDPNRWHVTYSTVLPLTWKFDADIVIGQRVCLPAPSRMWAEICADQNVKAIYEIDDNLLDMHHTNAAAALYSPEEVRNNIRRNAAMADLVTVSTEPLADMMREFNRNVVVIPNFIPAAALAMPRPRSADGVVVGYTGTTTHQIDYEVVQPHLRRLLDRHWDVIVQFLGAGYTGLPADRTRHCPWVDGVPAYLEMVALLFDIGIAPLRPHPFIRAKSRIKFLEYAALGIPAVVSDEPPYRDTVRHGETGFLVRRDHEWLKYLAALVEDEDLRAGVGAAARAWAAGETIEGNIGQWEKVLTVN